jgi:hypothetical protein
LYLVSFRRSNRELSKQSRFALFYYLTVKSLLKIIYLNTKKERACVIIVAVLILVLFFNRNCNYFITPKQYDQKPLKISDPVHEIGSISRKLKPLHRGHTSDIDKDILLKLGNDIARLKSVLIDDELKRSTVINSYDTGEISYCSFLLPAPPDDAHKQEYRQELRRLRQLVVDWPADLKADIKTIQDLLDFETTANGEVLVFKNRILTLYTSADNLMTIKGSVSDGENVEIIRDQPNGVARTIMRGAYGYTELSESEMKRRYGHFLNYKNN